MCLAVPGRLVEKLDESGGVAFGRVDFDGVARKVCTACVPEAQVGDFVLVHAGVALAVVDPQEAQRLLALFDADDAELDMTQPD